MWCIVFNQCFMLNSVYGTTALPYHNSTRISRMDVTEVCNCVTKPFRPLAMFECHFSKSSGLYVSEQTTNHISCMIMSSNIQELCHTLWGSW